MVKKSGNGKVNLLWKPLQMHMGRIYIAFRNNKRGLWLLYVQFQGEVSISGVLVNKNALIRVCNTSGGYYV